jgi:hypothetical protein
MIADRQAGPFRLAIRSIKMIWFIPRWSESFK